MARILGREVSLLKLSKEKEIFNNDNFQFVRVLSWAAEIGRPKRNYCCL